MFDDKFFEKVHKKRIAVIGDVMLDKFYYADMKKFSSDAPIPVARVNERKASPGGAANVARCLANLGCSPILLGFVGNDHNRESHSSSTFSRPLALAGIALSQAPSYQSASIL